MSAMLVAVYHRDGEQLTRVHNTWYGYIGPDWNDPSELRLCLPGRRTWPLSPVLPYRIAGALQRVFAGIALDNVECEIGRRYREAGLRKLASGDVLEIGSKPASLVLTRAGWIPVS